MKKGLGMSRSRRKNPVTGFTTADSEKWDKRQANRRLRQTNKRILAKGGEVFARKREVSNVWLFGKDGKQWLDDEVIEEQPELMRK